MSGKILFETWRCACGKTVSGVRSAALIERCRIREVVADPVSGLYREIRTDGDAAWAVCTFGEGRAVYTETLGIENGIPCVTHTLEFQTGRMDARSRELIAATTAASLCGIVAVVTAAEGHSFVVGYSEELGDERPLRLVSATGTTGKKPADLSGETVTLRSCDTSKARLYDGSPL